MNINDATKALIGIRDLLKAMEDIADAHGREIIAAHNALDELSSRDQRKRVPRSEGGKLLTLADRIKRLKGGV